MTYKWKIFKLQLINHGIDKKLKAARKNSLGHQILAGQLLENGQWKGNLGLLLKKHFVTQIVTSFT